MSEQEHVREPASSPCEAPPDSWDSGHDDRLNLRWSVTGPKKQENIEYTYSW
jgi:hypothetical protein